MSSNRVRFRPRGFATTFVEQRAFLAGSGIRFRQQDRVVRHGVADARTLDCAPEALMARTPHR